MVINIGNESWPRQQTSFSCESPATWRVWKRREYRRPSTKGVINPDLVLGHEVNLAMQQTCIDRVWNKRSVLLKVKSKTFRIHDHYIAPCNIFTFLLSNEVVTTITLSLTSEHIV